MSRRGLRAALLTATLVVLLGAVSACGVVRSAARASASPSTHASAGSVSYTEPARLCSKLDYGPLTPMIGLPHGGAKESSPTSCEQALATLESAELGDFYGTVSVSVYLKANEREAAQWYDDMRLHHLLNTTLDKVSGVVGVGSHAYSYQLKSTAGPGSAVKGLALNARDGNLVITVTVIAGRKLFSGVLWTEEDVARLTGLMGDFINKTLPALTTP